MVGDVYSPSIKQAFRPFAHDVLRDVKKLCGSEGVPLFIRHCTQGEAHTRAKAMKHACILFILLLSSF